jgi:hypothetical protein
MLNGVKHLLLTLATVRRSRVARSQGLCRNRLFSFTHQASRITIPCLLVSLTLCLLVSAAKADRLVLAPRALITVPGSAKLEYAVSGSGSQNNLGWISAGLPGSLNGFEIEGEQACPAGTNRWTGSIQYSFTGNAFTDVAPAFSVGLRDVANTGPEGLALFAAASKTIPLNARLEQLLKQFWVDAGIGTGHLGGPYIGIQGRLRIGPAISAEYLARRFNASIAIPVLRHLDLKAYTLNGHTYYGAALFLVK